MNYIVTIEEHDGKNRTKGLRLLIHDDNLPVKTAIGIVDGVGVITEADRFGTLAENILETVRNMTENPTEVAVQRIEDQTH